MIFVPGSDNSFVCAAPDDTKRLPASVHVNTPKAITAHRAEIANNRIDAVSTAWHPARSRGNFTVEPMCVFY